MNHNNLPTSASFLLSEDCNLACTYCFELGCRNNKKMSKEVATKGLEYLSDNAVKIGEKNFSVMMFGGEPMLNLEVMEHVFKTGLELAEKKNLNFNASIVTNATIYNDEVERIIKMYGPETGFSIQLSVDGIKEIHDKYRVTRDGKGSFDTIEKNIPKWLALTKEGIDVSIHGCSNKETLPYLFENYLFFRETWGFERIWFMPIHSENWDYDDVKVYEDELNKIATYVLAKSKENGNVKEVDFYAPLDRCLMPDRRSSAPCGAGKNFITITAEGELYPCHQFYFNDPEKHTMIGNVWTGIIEDRRKIYTEYDANDLSCLKKNPSCDAVGCYICIADNYTINGSILSTVVGPRCAMSKIERKIQLRVREELNRMGLFDKQKDYDNGDACKCNSRNVFEQNREHGHSCGCGNSEEKEFQKELIITMAGTIAEMGEIIQNMSNDIKKLKEDTNVFSGNYRLQIENDLLKQLRK